MSVNSLVNSKRYASAWIYICIDKFRIGFNKNPNDIKVF